MMNPDSSPASLLRLGTLLFNSWTAEQALRLLTPLAKQSPIAVPQAYHAALFSAKAMLQYTMTTDYQSYESEHAIWLRIAQLSADGRLYLIPGTNLYEPLCIHRPRLMTSAPLVDAAGLRDVIKQVDQINLHHEVRIAQHIGADAYRSILNDRPCEDMHFAVDRFSMINANLRYA